MVGIWNASLSQRLMQDDKKTLNKAVKEAKSSELVKHHHNILQGDGKDGRINCLRKNKGQNKLKSPENLMGDRTFKPSEAGKCQCYQCGKLPVHKKDACPAINTTCLKCKKQGHFAVVCRSKKVRSVTAETESKSSRSEDYFLGGISKHENKDDSSVNLSLGTTKVRFNIDIAANATVMPEADYLQSGLPQCRTTSKTLFGPGREKLPVKGVIKGVLKTSSLKETLQDIYVIGNLKEPLLGRPATNALNLV